MIPTPIHELDKPRTLGEAADALGKPYPVVQRAARRGLVRAGPANLDRSVSGFSA